MPKRYLKEGELLMSRCFVFCFFLLFFNAAWSGEKINIEYFGTNELAPLDVDTYQNDDVNLTVFNLDDHTNIERMLSENLPINDLQKAIQIAKSRVKNIGQDKLRDLFVGAQKANQYGIKKIPAIVINEVAIIYGVRSIKQALYIYRRS